MNKKELKFAGLTKAEIEALKEKHGYVELYEVPTGEVEDEENKASFILTKPSRKVIMAMAKYAQEKDLDRANNVLIKSCVLAGDMEALDEEKGSTDVYLSVLDRLGKLTEVKKGAVKKL